MKVVKQFKGSVTMRKLICAKDVSACHEKGQTTLMVPQNALVTALARDLAEEFQMTIVEEKIEKVPSVDDFSNLNQKQLVALLKAMLQASQKETQGFDSFKHESGFVQIKGESIQLVKEKQDRLGHVLKYQPTLESSHSVSGRLTFNQSNYEWHETTDYRFEVLSGSLTVQIEEQRYDLVRGDTFFLPKATHFTFLKIAEVTLHYTEYLDK